MLPPAPPLIGLAHGSRDPRSAHTVGEVMAAVRALRPGLRATAAFLDLSEPDLTASVRELRATTGCWRAVVLPLLFSEAFHAKVDAPEAVDRAQTETGVVLDVGEILGTGDDVLEVLQNSAERAGIAAHEAILLLAVGSSRDEANLAVHELAFRWAERRPAPVWAGFATVGEPHGSAVLNRARSERRRIGVVPLFVAPGLLLDGIAEQAALMDATVAPPLGTALAGLVLRRYDEARAARARA
jgi:sirohydrochlorin cobaltochelatase